MTVNVAVDSQVGEFVQKTEAVLGPIDAYVSNAGVLMTDEPSWDAAGATDANWQLAFEVNLMGAVRGARHVWPGMRERGGGIFVIVASAAGLLAQIGAAPYTATKHAVVAFAESLSIAHGDDGLQVSVSVHRVCVQRCWVTVTTVVSPASMVLLNHQPYPTLRLPHRRKNISCPAASQWGRLEIARVSVIAGWVECASSAAR
ncbi:MAG: hypothetical protein Ct9H300mP16_12790 [Pseudomonadota bacterium]|nr:MAG: hypothetical protein Ct9H300mP16_12790 [Pseudomonadota bacterium]